jgi:hypothetical protein
MQPVMNEQRHDDVKKVWCKSTACYLVLAQPASGMMPIIANAPIANTAAVTGIFAESPLRQV